MKAETKGGSEHIATWWTLVPIWISGCFMSSIGFYDGRLGNYLVKEYILFVTWLYLCSNATYRCLHLDGGHLQIPKSSSLLIT